VPGVKWSDASGSSGFCAATHVTNKDKDRSGGKMARIAGVDLPKRKKIGISLTYIYGIGRTTALKILDASGVDWTRKTEELTSDEVNVIRGELENNYKVEGDLRREKSADIKRLMDIGCYRGLRHRRSMPVRGQRTHTNARIRKGPKKTTIKKKK